MEDREFDYINVVPLVDIMLVLLTIVLTTATFVVQGDIPINIPSAKEPREMRTHERLDISITRDGKIFFAGKEVSPKELFEILRDYDRKTTVGIKADRSARIQSFVSVVDILNRLGFRKISIVVKKYGD